MRRALADCRHGAQVLPSSHDCLAVSPWVGADVAGRGGQLACGSLHLSRPVLSCEALKSRESLEVITGVVERSSNQGPWAPGLPLDILVYLSG